MIIVNNNILNKFSSLNKLIRITALCLRFINNAKIKTGRITEFLTTQELNNANAHIVKIYQKIHFKEELSQLKTNGIVSGKSQIASLSPFLDEQNIIRVGGRLQNSTLSYNAKHPILLPAKSSFTQLVIAHKHHKQLHAGVQATIAAIRTKY